ncbi:MULTISPECIES: FAD-binding dehydrogenase [unclassified Bosea (in: a-proteobacteria)]|uniref:FAD-binding dehydrogenase n=1 Tax=unclassified Bosea (in: a-proteobacteria) TaxID=2653178 RepID=UPI000F75C756|nr:MULTISPECIES: FAD-binding dehydrogenase [unclassified Bosea (in: a-proteobacteria)]AZO78088.1 FAD-binding dehydrogenase [Bosea sp. Tri-49]RXT20434.1 FAD-binding dehydrogenase [Bosea sp. Tri-39]RXT37306.1 FAD-binding dehydrogenase [Bosea sp. Tri-54]
MALDADVVIVGAGLAGLVAAAELAGAGCKVIIVEQEPRASLGGQAHWSFGGLFLIDSPEQRRLRIRDSLDLARQDWLGSAGFDRDEDHWPRAWADAYLDFASGEKRSWLHRQGMRWFPVVGWAERGGYLATGHGNSVPRFHVTWGTGPGVLEPFLRRVAEAEAKGLIELRFRHRVIALTRSGGAVDGVEGEVLEASAIDRGQASSRVVAGGFAIKAQAVIVASGGIGGNHDLVRRNWPQRLGEPPQRMLSGVPAHVDGAMLAVAEAAGGRLINGDRMWHYVEGIANWAPIWPAHAIRILPGPSSLWFDARGRRLPVPLFPGFDTLGTLEYLRKTGFDHSWFVTSRSIVAKEFALSGSEQNPDLTGKSWRQVIQRARAGMPAPVQAFLDKGEDFIVERDFPRMVARMNELGGAGLIDEAHLRAQIEARDRDADNPYGKDLQVTALRGARAYLGDRLIRTAKPHRILDPAHGPLVAVRLNILTRKSLGGLMTDLSARVLGADGEPVPGLYAVGEAAGFGGGGLHGYRALEGTFLGGCIFSGRVAGRAAAKAVR